MSNACASKEMGSQGQPIYVVSGLPRSGTSMMMQILAAVGVPLLIDDSRPPDEDNPRGYYEYEPVKRSREDLSWLAQAPGRAVKVVHLLLHELPPDRRYKLIFMRRNLDEVLRSQQKMLSRRNLPGGRLSVDAMKQVFRQQLARVDGWITEQACFEKVDVDYNLLLADPQPPLEMLLDFLQLKGATEAAIASIVPSLYRTHVT